MSRQWEEMPTSVARLNVNWLLRKEGSNRDDSTSEDIVTSTTMTSDDVLNVSNNSPIRFYQAFHIVKIADDTFPINVAGLGK